jgi:glyoxylase-like metal-dependent hydrolase (beta-lactamase superfamily II)
MCAAAVLTAGALAVSPAWPLLAQQAPAAQAPPPLVKENATRRVSDHVHAIPDESVPLVPNVGIIVGTRATLVVDTGLGPRNGAAILREVGKVSRNTELYIVTTHVHPEHDLGAQAFPAQAKMIRSEDQQKDIAEFGLQTAKQFAGRSPLTAELLQGAEFRKADIVFATEHALDLGGVRVRILAMGANHTRGDTAVFVEPDNVLFSGDVAMTGLPAFSSPASTVRQWLTSLDRFEQLRPATIVPSHGPFGGPEIITNYRTYLQTVQARVTALKREGRSLPEVEKAVTGELSAKYPGGRLAGTVRAAYAEAP